MLKKIDVAKAFLKDHQELFQCPKCHEKMFQINTALKCTNGHTFELSKKGTLFFLEKPVQTEYTKDMFLHRKKAIELGLYQPMLEILTSFILPNEPILDVGCGEGSFLSLLGETFVKEPKLGFDLSKEGIYLASENRGEDLFFHVADLTSLPYGNQQIGTILNIFSPSNYQEFRRVVKKDGLLMKVIPGSDYLKEIRQSLYEGDKSHYSNVLVKEKLKEEVHILKEEECRYSFPIPKVSFEDVIKMTPLSWSAQEEKLTELLNHPFSELTIHLHILKCQMKEK